VSRKIRRVPLDFHWPIDKVWQGYLMPDELTLPPCPDCRHGSDYPSGYSREANAIHDTFYPHQIVNAGAWPGAGEHAERLAWYDKLGQAEVDMLVAEGNLRHHVNREPTDDNPRTWEWLTVPRTAADVNAANRHPRSGTRDRELEHDAGNRYLLVKFRCSQLGIPLYCPTCNGEANLATVGQRQAQEAWEPTEPPSGDGWQLWETVTEGSPQSPVFSDAESLATWMADPARGSDWVPAPVAAQFIAAGWAPTGVSVPGGGIVGGVEFIGTQEQQ
jgi:hypothetical protein